MRSRSQVVLPPSPARIINTLLQILRWLNMTPFGCPVVPLEYTKNAKSFSGSTRLRLHFMAVDGSTISRQCLNPATRLSPTIMMRSLGIPAFAAAAVATGSNSGNVAIAFAPASFSWNVSSSTV
jgi:hypothetical protein